MYEHQRLLWKIGVIAGGLVLVAVLVTVAGASGGKPDENYAFLAAMGIMFVLSFTSARWILRGIEAITGFRFVLSFPLLGVLYMLGTIFSFVVLPVGLVVLVTQYTMARRRFRRDMELTR